MGTTVSRYPVTPSDYPVFSLTIRATDRIKLIDANAAVVNIVRHNLQTHYGRIQNEFISNDGGTCFKLSGFPFCKTGGFDLSVRTKHFFKELFSNLLRHGWKLWLNSDLSRLYDYSTLFFSRCPPIASNFSMCCLSLSSHDKFQLIDAPEHLNDALLSCMHGHLWQNWSYTQSTKARSLLLSIFRTFRQYGYALFGTVNLKGTADSIFFINDGSTLTPEQYCVISLNAQDRLRLIGCPKNLVDMTSNLISAQWPGGLQNTNHDGECVEFKMKGRPWFAYQRHSAVESRHFIATLLQASVKNGWAVLASLDVSRKPTDKAVFVMRSCTPMSIPHFCIAPASRDLIRIIGADHEMETLVANVFKQCWSPGIQHESKDCNNLELKLRGVPWHSYSFSDSFALARMTMTRVLTALEERGWSVICSADVSAKYIHNNDNSNSDHPCDVHAWFVAKTSLISSLAGPSTTGTSLGFAPPSYKEAVEFS
uniref:Reverse transcriptase domain-containing protein n=1 Tax=Steinernema glaseri TaxID=37863 RepID=A0A1I8ACU0_9BILA